MQNPTHNQLLLPLPKKSGWHDLPLVISPANEKTIALLQRPDQWQDGALCLSGDVGSGKSFIAWYLFRKSPAHQSLGFMIKNNQMADIKNHPPHHIIIWDNIDQALPNLSPAAAKDLCYFFNQPQHQRPKLLLLAQKSLSLLLKQQANYLLTDLSSRLSLIAQLWLVADDINLRAQAFGFFAERQIAVNDKIIDRILRDAPRSHQALHHILLRLDDYAFRNKKTINPNMINQWLNED
ncbi:MAG: hypothetical protein ACR2NY_04555 [Alphaproteobacteria bacterium]